MIFGISPYEQSGADTINLLPEKLPFKWDDDDNLLVQFVQMCRLGTFSVFDDLINFVFCAYKRYDKTMIDL